MSNVKNKQPLSNQAEKLISQMRSLMSGKSDLRSKGGDTYRKHMSNLNTIGREMAKLGYQNAKDFKFKTYQHIINELDNRQLKPTTIESFHSTMRKLADTIGKGDMIPRSLKDSMGRNDLHRSTDERIKPQYWADRATRDASPQAQMSRIDKEYAAVRLESQERMEKLDPKYASASNMAMHFGLRKQESLAARELVYKDENGKLYSTSGSKVAGEYRELKDIKAVRYAFTNNKENQAFEREYLATMKPNQEYLYVPGGWSKGSHHHLTPVMNAEAKAAAIRQQEIIRDNQSLARSLKITSGRTGVKVNSVIDPRMSKEQGKTKYTHLLQRAGFEKQQIDDKDEKASMHADRTEFLQRMAQDKDEKGDYKWDREDAMHAVGHHDEDKVDHYGGWRD